MAVEMVKIEVMVPKETHELKVALVKVVTAIKAALADGWQPGVDVPVIVAEALDALPPAVAGMEKIPTEFSEERNAALKDLTHLGFDIADIFKK